MQTEQQATPTGPRAVGEMNGVDSRKGFCWLLSGDGLSYFLHKSDLYGKKARLVEGAKVEFTPAVEADGKPRAIEAVFLELQYIAEEDAVREALSDVRVVAAPEVKG